MWRGRGRLSRREPVSDAQSHTHSGKPPALPEDFRSSTVRGAVEEGRQSRAPYSPHPSTLPRGEGESQSSVWQVRCVRDLTVACSCPSLPTRNEWGESRREGRSAELNSSSPTLSSLLRREERENGTRAWALFADMVAESAQNLKSNARLTAWVSVLPNFMRPEIFSASQDGSVVPK